jgi:hypothetical protein
LSSRRNFRLFFGKKRVHSNPKKCSFFTATTNNVSVNGEEPLRELPAFLMMTVMMMIFVFITIIRLNEWC